MNKLISASFIAIVGATTMFGFEHLKSVEQFEETIKKGNIIVDFYASWCNPCKEMEQNLKKLSAQTKDIKIYKINIEESVELLEKYGTPQVPALLYIKDGEILQGYVGLKQMKELQNDMKKYFKNSKG